MVWIGVAGIVVICGIFIAAIIKAKMNIVSTMNKQVLRNISN